jgi:hypothetical protein
MSPPPEASGSIDHSAGMSPEQATEQLASLQAAYSPPPVGFHVSTPTEAAQQLAQLEHTPDFIRKLQSGDVEAMQKWQELKIAATPVDFPVESIIETTTGDMSVTHRDLIGVAENMRAEGVFNDEGIEFILSDRKFPTEDVRVAQYYLAQMESDETVLYPDLPGDRELQMKFLRTIATIGDGSMP